MTIPACLPEPPFALVAPLLPVIKVPTLPTLPILPAAPCAQTNQGQVSLGNTVDVTAAQPLIITGLVEANCLTTFKIEQGATLGLEASLTTDVLTTIDFAGANGTLILSPGFKLDCGSQIDGFAAGDRIDYKAPIATLSTCYTPGISILGQQISPPITVVNLSNEQGQAVGTLRLVGDYRNELHLADDGDGGTTITCFCLLAGTAIATPDGEVAVETLRAGMMVNTPDGPRAVTWVGRRAIDLGSHPAPDAVRPVRITAGAFGPALPARDLVVSPDHAIYIDGVMIPAKHLVNGTTVSRDYAIANPLYVHVELEQHGVLYAEGLTVESYLDIGSRSSFFADAEAAPRLHPDIIRAAWDARGYAPLAVTGPAVDAVRARLDACAAARLPRAETARAA